MVGAGSVAVEGRKRVERAAAHLMRAVERRAILFLVVEVDSSASVEEAQVAVVERVGGELVAMTRMVMAPDTLSCAPVGSRCDEAEHKSDCDPPA